MEELVKNAAYLARFNQFYMAARLKSLHIGLGQYPYLLHICNSPGIVQDRLAGTLQMHKSSVARAVAALEKAGYITREASTGDKRAFRLFPTQRAVDCLPAVYRELEACARQMTNGFSREEKRQAAALLERMAANMYPGPRPGAVEPGQIEEDEK